MNSIACRKIIISVCALIMFLLVGVNASAASKGVPIDSKHFSADMSKLCKKYDKNKDGYLSGEERKKITKISEGDFEDGSRTIFDFRGLEYLESIKYLHCLGVRITNLKFNGLKNLQDISLADCEINKVNLHNMTKLKKVSLQYMEKSKISISKCPNIEYLSLAFVKKDKINIGNYKKLKELLIYGKVKPFDISKLKLLRKLEIDGLNWEKIDLSKNTLLKYIYIKSDKLKRIKLPKNKERLNELDLQAPVNLLDLPSYKNLNFLNLIIKKADMIDISGCHNIQFAHIKVPFCSDIQFGNQPKLDNLYINAPISSIDLSKAPKLKKLELKCELSNIELEKNRKIEQLIIDGPIEKLDISKNTKLKECTFKGFVMDEMIFSNASVGKLEINNSSLETLDVTSLPELYSVVIKRSAVRKIIANGNPELRDIEADVCDNLKEVVINNNERLFIYKFKDESDWSECYLSKIRDEKTGTILVDEKYKAIHIWGSKIRKDAMWYEY